MIPVFSALDIATIIAVETEKFEPPTPEQATVIEQPLGGSVLVIAGAGSGKTETMANRVVWLVANSLAQPEEVLGLTFTRKAAGELGERVTEQLQRFLRCLALPQVQDTLDKAQRAQAALLSERMADGLHTPDVSTYNSFASAVVTEFGAFAGLAAGSEVIDAATAWGIARDIVCASDDERLADSRASLGTLVKQVITLDHAIADNLTSFDAVLEQLERARHIDTLPYNEKKPEGRYVLIDQVLADLNATEVAVDLARAFAAEKRRRGVLEFSDQLALAVETLRRSPDAVRTLRRRTPVVLLDEVQDTSVGQTTLLSTLFAGNSVMAVGDPHQSIYGFRGASASNLQTFHHDFRATDQHGGLAKSGLTLPLSISWRNPASVLKVANAVSAPLSAALEGSGSGLTVEELTSGEEYVRKLLGPDAPPPAPGPPQVECIATETLEAEFEALATWMRDARNEHLAREKKPATAAVVCRARKHMPAISAALWRAGVPNQIVGIGGLLTTPEVTDLVSALRCLWHADASNELLRLLSGPRFRVGAADLAGLSYAARWFSQRDHAKQPIDRDLLTTDAGLQVSEQQFTLLDALDEIAGLRSLEHRALERVSELGRDRLREAGQLLHQLRREVGGDIPSLLRSVTQALLLDIELDAAEHTGYDGAAVARANLDAFTDLVLGFLATDEQGTLASVLDWLERATEDDEPAEHVPEPEPSTVQLITVHGAKGLQWHLVAVPRLVEGEFPASAREGKGWLRPGQLPDALRGDRAARPTLDFEAADTQAEVREAIAAYQTELKAQAASEERRLAYVAFTRTRSRLLLTASFWGGQKSARPLAPYLREIAAASLIPELPVASEFDADPTPVTGRTETWPLDPLGSRAQAVHTAAAVLREALDASETLDTSEASESAQAAADALGDVPGGDLRDALRDPSRTEPGSTVELLLKERDADRDRPAAEATKAERITASTFHEFIENPAEAERRRLRPMPVRPYRRTRVGNLFHEWVERRAGTALGTSLTLAGVDEALEASLERSFDVAGEDVAAANGLAEAFSESEPVLAADERELHSLIEQFEASRFAGLQPIAIELEITLPFAETTLVCKLDAVYEAQPDSTAQVEIVDWKSGVPPRTDAERHSRFLQLDLYRHAYAQWAGIDPALIDVTLFYVADGTELRATHSRSMSELEVLWRASRQAALPVGD